MLECLAQSPAARFEITRDTGCADGSVFAAINALEGQEKIRRTGDTRQGSNGGRPSPVYELVADDPSPAPSLSGESNVVDRLVDNIVGQLEVDGGRVSRDDLKNRIGDQDFTFEDFELALDRAVTLGKIAKVRVGGVAGYELAKGGAR